MLGVGMLRISAQKSSATIRRLYATARYYEQGLGIIGRWGGRGAERLGLRGTVTISGLNELYDNRHPTSGERLTVRVRPNRTIAYTFRFSLPKSVSLLYGLYREENVLEAFRDAIAETMLEIESEMMTRVRKGGVQGERATGNLIWAEFVHTTAGKVREACDPQLQGYVCVFNATWDEAEECWKAGWFRDIKKHAPYFEAAFRARAAYRLRSLGYAIATNGHDFEIAGFPGNVLRAFSRRTDVVEKRSVELGVTHPVVKRSLGPKTREGGLPKWWTPETLSRDWALRLSQAEADAIARVFEHRTPFQGDADQAARIVDSTLQRLAGCGVVSERRILAMMFASGFGEATVEEIRKELSGRMLVRRGQGRDAIIVL